MMAGPVEWIYVGPVIGVCFAVVLCILVIIIRRKISKKKGKKPTAERKKPTRPPVYELANAPTKEALAQAQLRMNDHNNDQPTAKTIRYSEVIRLDGEKTTVSFDFPFEGTTEAADKPASVEGAVQAAEQAAEPTAKPATNPSGYSEIMLSDGQKTTVSSDFPFEGTAETAVGPTAVKAPDQADESVAKPATNPIHYSEVILVDGEKMTVSFDFPHEGVQNDQPAAETAPEPVAEPPAQPAVGPAAGQSPTPAAESDVAVAEAAVRPAVKPEAESAPRSICYSEVMRLDGEKTTVSFDFSLEGIPTGQRVTEPAANPDRYSQVLQGEKMNYASVDFPFEAAAQLQ